MTGIIMQGHVLELLRGLADDTIDLAITSPPYYGLRAYGKETETDWPDGWHGQLGLEPTVDLYIDHLMLVIRELKRVLKPTGSIYLNIGDTYASSMGDHGDETAGFSKEAMVRDKPPRPRSPEMGRMLIPSRIALRMQEEGLMCMDEIIWRKPNHMPSSVKGRLANSWEPIFRFVKNSKTILWRIMRDHAGYKAGTWLTERPNTPYREYLLERDWDGDKAGDWVSRKPPKNITDQNVVAYPIGPEAEGGFIIWQKSRTNWLGFSYYYELDAIREPHKTSSHPRFPGGGVDGPITLLKHPTGQITKEASLEYGYGSKWTSYKRNLAGVPPEDVAAPEYSGKFLADPESVNSPRARMARPGYDPAKFYAEGGGNPGDVTIASFLPGGEKPNSLSVIGGAHDERFYNPAGKNPEDTIEDSKGMNVPGQEPQHGLRKPGHQGDWSHESGANPADVAGPDGFPTDPPHTSYGTRRDISGSMYPRSEPGHPEGKNPGDVWEEILRDRAERGGGAQREAYNAYLAWKAEHPGGTYEQFFDEVSSAKISAHQDMKWSGIDNKQTAWGNYAAYLHLPNPKGQHPVDVEDEVKERIGDAHDGNATAHLYMPHVKYHEKGGNPADVVMEHREKDDDRHRLDHLSLPPQPEVDPGRAFHPDGGNPGDTVEGSETVYVKTRPSAGSDLRAGNDDRLSEARGHGGWKGNNLLRADGGNPGDVAVVPSETRTFGAIIGEQGAVKVPGGAGWTGHPEGGMARIVREGDPRWLPPTGKNPQDFWSITTQPFKEAHFAVFPLGICWNPILSSCPPDGVVLDPFGGSGTVAEAVELTNILGKKAKDRDLVATTREGVAKGQKPLVPEATRKWILMEISPAYVQIAEKRLRPYR